MRSVEGYLITARSSVPIKQEWLFGRSINYPNQPYENFSTNGLSPFVELEELRIAYQKFYKFYGNRKKREFNRIGFASISMEIAQNLEETEQLRSSTNLVVLKINPDSFIDMIGRGVRGGARLGYIPGCLLETNGFRPFPNYERAYHCGLEVNRQGQCSALLATFEFKRVPKRILL